MDGIIMSALQAGMLPCLQSLLTGARSSTMATSILSQILASMLVNNRLAPLFIHLLTRCFFLLPELPPYGPTARRLGRCFHNSTYRILLPHPETMLSGTAEYVYPAMVK